MFTMTLPWHDCIIHFNAYIEVTTIPTAKSIVQHDVTLCPYTQAGDSAPVAAVSVMQRHTAGSGRAKPANVLVPITVTALTQHLR